MSYHKVRLDMLTFFWQGTTRRPEARGEGRGREEERKAPSYGDHHDADDDYYDAVHLIMMIEIKFCDNFKLSEERKTPYQMFLEDDGPYSRWVK